MPAKWPCAPRCASRRRAGCLTASCLGNIKSSANSSIVPAIPVYEGMILGENSREARHERQRNEGKKATQHALLPAPDEAFAIPHRT